MHLIDRPWNAQRRNLERNTMIDLTKASQEELAARQKILEDEISGNEEEIRLYQAELDKIYAEQDRRRG